MEPKITLKSEKAQSLASSNQGTTGQVGTSPSLSSTSASNPNSRIQFAQNPVEPMEHGSPLGPVRTGLQADLLSVNTMTMTDNPSSTVSSGLPSAMTNPSLPLAVALTLLSRNSGQAASKPSGSPSMDAADNKDSSRAGTQVATDCDDRLGEILLSANSTGQGSVHRIRLWRSILAMPGPTWTTSVHDARYPRLYQLANEMGQDERALLMNEARDASTLPIDGQASHAELQKRELELALLYRTGKPGMKALTEWLATAISKRVDKMSYPECQLHLRNTAALLNALESWASLTSEIPIKHVKELLDPATMPPSKESSESEIMRRAVGLEAIYSRMRPNDAGNEIMLLADDQNAAARHIAFRPIQLAAIASLRRALGDTACAHWAGILRARTGHVSDSPVFSSSVSNSVSSSVSTTTRTSPGTSSSTITSAAMGESDSEISQAEQPRTRSTSSATLENKGTTTDQPDALVKDFQRYQQSLNTDSSRIFSQLPPDTQSALIARLKNLDQLALTRPEQFHDTIARDPILSSFRDQLHEEYANINANIKSRALISDLTDGRTLPIESRGKLSQVRHHFPVSEGPALRDQATWIELSMRAIGIDAFFQASLKSSLAGELFREAYASNQPFEAITTLREMQTLPTEPSRSISNETDNDQIFRVFTFDSIRRALGEHQLKLMAGILEVPADGKGS